MDGCKLLRSHLSKPENHQNGRQAAQTNMFHMASVHICQVHCFPALCTELAVCSTTAPPHLHLKVSQTQIPIKEISMGSG